MQKRLLCKIPINQELDLLSARQESRKEAVRLGFNLVDQTRLVTAVSELTRNTLKYAGQGVMYIQEVVRDLNTGIMITVIDHGPGIKNIDKAMVDGFSSSGGLGKGLSGTQKLMDDFRLVSKPWEKTEVEIIKWKR